jgi:glycosyltransferase involved in cell wall biosynthesis
LAVGGFDENFIPPVSFRFETEFARRLATGGGKIRFEPQAAIRHLRAGSGGTRARGGHMASASPLHGVGDTYYALRCGRGWDRLWHILKRPFREVHTKFHLRHPWWIPVKFIGELRAIRLAVQLNQSGPKLLTTNETRRILLINTAAPDRPDGSMVRYARMVRQALECHGCGAFQVEEINLAPAQAWLSRFPVRWQTLVRYAWIAMAARRLLRRKRPAILHLLDGSHAYLLGAVRLRSPLVVTVHDLIPLLRLRGELGDSRPGCIGGWLIRRAADNLARADAVAAVSANTRADVIRLANVPPERVRVVPHAMELDSAVPEPRPSASPPYLLHVAGNNTFYKNRQGVVEVFKQVRQSEPVRLVLAGAPPDAALSAAVTASGLASEIEFRPHVTEAELASLYRNAALLLFPSLYEGFGWPPLEAMLQGCPVVCSDAGSLPEVVGNAALTARSGDIAALAGHAVRLLRDPGLRQRLAEEGLRHVRTFTSEALASGLCAVYDLATQVFSGKNQM